MYLAAICMQMVIYMVHMSGIQGYLACNNESVASNIGRGGNIAMLLLIVIVSSDDASHPLSIDALPELAMSSLFIS